jgi:predicted transcriptional regulator
MNPLCDLLFELSSNERMNIILSLLEERLKLSHVSKKLDMTVTEASRHLQRLSDVKLIDKDVEGTFGPTQYGQLAIKLLSSLDFISTNRQYFLEHDLSNLPYEFLSRIHSLSLGKLNTDVVRVLPYVDSMFLDANEYIWVMSYTRALPSTIPIVEEKLKNGVSLRRVFPEDVVTSQGGNTSITGPRRTLPSLDIRIVMTENEAMCSFPLMDGKIDYTSFIGKDPKFHKWCKDVFLHYWERAKPDVL